MNYKPYILFISFVVLGLVAIFLVSSGYYPVLSVDGSFVSARTFWKNYQAGSTYYNFLRKNYQDNFPATSTLSAADIKRSVLTQLVENELIANEVKKEVGNDLDYLVKSKIGTLTQDPNLKSNARTVYGMNSADFENEILAPIARSEILTGRLFLKGEKLDSWLAEAKKISSIRIYSRNFYWDGEEVKAK